MPNCNRFTRRPTIVTSLILAVLVGSCSSKKGGFAYELPPEATMQSTPAAPPAPAAADLALQDREMLEQAQGDPRARLIKSEAELTIETKAPDSLHQRLADRTEVLGGYVVESSKLRTQVRIPAAEFDLLLDDMNTWGKVSKRIIKGADVTETFRDLRVDLDQAELRRNRLLQLLGQTDEVDAKLKIEAELERVSVQIDRLTALLAAQRHDLKFATITLETTKPDKDWKPGYVLEGLGAVLKGVRSLFVVR